MNVLTFVEIDIEITGQTGGSFDSQAFSTSAFSGAAFDFGSQSVLEDTTFRFSYPTDEAPQFDSIPALDSVSITPGVADPGVSIGKRASVSFVVKDFQYPLAGTSFSSGTFFGKLRAFRSSVQGLAVRVIRGQNGQDIGDMVVEHYVAESLSRSGDKITIVAKDILKLADGSRSQAPVISNGRLLSDISDVDTSLTLAPSGIGDLEYPASGKAVIGGDEIVSFTRSGDAMTITRAQSATEASDHDTDDIVQLVIEYSSASPADIIYDLLTNYTEIDPAWCPLSEWQDDIDEYIGRLYSAEISEPTPVKDLLNEIILQVGLVMWWDEVAQKIRLKSLRPVIGSRTVEENEMIADSFRFMEQPSKRRSQSWTYYALKNPLERIDEVKNFAACLITADLPSELVYGQAAIGKIFSRWIAKNNRPAASRLNELIISRYANPPRKISFDLLRTSDQPSKGQGLILNHSSFQDAQGDIVDVPVTVTSVKKSDSRYSVECEEMLFTPIEDPENPTVSRLLIIDSNSYNINLRTLHDSFYTEISEYDDVLFIIDSGVIVGSTSTSNPALDIGDWPDYVSITVRINGRIQGRGGDGGDGTSAGSAGGLALYTRYGITVENNGQIYGGGGGGGSGMRVIHGSAESGGGGGGAGLNPGFGGPPSGQSGTTEFGGRGFRNASGDGGDPGEAGEAGNTAAGGAAGDAIDGVSFVTFDVVGTIAGPQIN